MGVRIADHRITTAMNIAADTTTRPAASASGDSCFNDSCTRVNDTLPMAMFTARRRYADRRCDDPTPLLTPQP